MTKKNIQIIFILIILLFNSCDNSGIKSGINNSISITVKGIPGEVSSGGNPDDYYITTVFWKDDVLLEAFTSEEQYVHNEAHIITYDVKKEFTQISVYLHPSNTYINPYYFNSLEPNNENSYEIIYWLKYNKYFDSNIISYGVSDFMMIDVEYGKEYILDFNTTPYYLFGVEEAINESFTVYIDNPTENVNPIVTYRESFSHGGLPINQKIYYEDFDREKYSILVTPSNNYIVDCKITFDNFNSNEEYLYSKKVDNKNVIHLGEKRFIVDDQTDLKLVDFELEVVKTLFTFESNITNIILSNDELFISAGDDLWKYNIEIDSLDLIYSTDYTIENVIVSDTKIVLDGYYSGRSVLDRSNSTLLDWYDIDESIRAVWSIYFQYKAEGNVMKFFPNEDKYIITNGVISKTDGTFYQDIGFHINDVYFYDNELFIINDDRLIFLYKDGLDYRKTRDDILFEEYLNGQNLFVNDETNKVIVLAQSADFSIHYLEYNIP